MLNHWARSQQLQQTGSLCAGPLLPRLGLSIVCSDQICRGFTASGPFVFHSFRAQSATKCSVCLVFVRTWHGGRIPFTSFRCEERRHFYLFFIFCVAAVPVVSRNSGRCCRRRCRPVIAADNGTALDGLRTKNTAACELFNGTTSRSVS